MKRGPTEDQQKGKKNKQTIILLKELKSNDEGLKSTWILMLSISIWILSNKNRSGV